MVVALPAATLSSPVARALLGAVRLKAGFGCAASAGESVHIEAGPTSGGVSRGGVSSGGSVSLVGCMSSVQTGGSVSINGGSAASGLGGPLLLSGGSSQEGSSGSLAIRSMDTATTADSGSVSLMTGSAKFGQTGGYLALNRLECRHWKCGWLSRSIRRCGC